MISALTDDEQVSGFEAPKQDVSVSFLGCSSPTTDYLFTHVRIHTHLTGETRRLLVSSWEEGARRPWLQALLRLDSFPFIGHWALGIGHWASMHW
jgi:hypothetical protein